MKWKCRLQKASPEFVVDMLQRLPEECIKETTEAFRRKCQQIVEAKESLTVGPTFLVSRDARMGQKRKAAESVLRFVWRSTAPSHRRTFICFRVAECPEGCS